MQDEVKVTQADREAAIQALNAAERQRSFGGNGTVLGQVAEIFARHRHQAERDTLARMEWRDIESAPKDGAVIDLWVRPYTGSAYRACAYWWLESAGVWRTDIRERDIPKKHTPTHWMPLPPAPEAV